MVNENEIGGFGASVVGGLVHIIFSIIYGDHTTGLTREDWVDVASEAAVAAVGAFFFRPLPQV